MRRFRVVIERQGEVGITNEQKTSQLAIRIKSLLEAHSPEYVAALRFILETGPEEKPPQLEVKTLFSVHCGLQPPLFFEDYSAAKDEYFRRSADTTNKFLGWVGMLRDGELCHYNGWERNDVLRLSRLQLENP